MQAKDLYKNWNKSRHFYVEELVPKNVFKKFGDHSIWFIDERVMLTLISLRGVFGALTANDWLFGGGFEGRGFRQPTIDIDTNQLKLKLSLMGLNHKDESDILAYFDDLEKDSCGGATYSQHKFGRACDVVSRKTSAQEMRDYIIQNRNKFPHITTLEDTVSWLHFDIRPTNNKNINTFKP